MKSSSSTGSYQLVGILLDQNNQTDDDGEVIMATVRTRRLSKANRNLLRPRPWDLSSCEQRALWLCALPPPWLEEELFRLLQQGKSCCGEKERERDLLLFLSSHHWRARPWPAGKRAPTIFLSLKREVLSLVQVESNLRIKSA